jgi:hypothetical protein
MKQLCEGLEASLQFRDDIVEDMAMKNSVGAFGKCQQKMQAQ